MAGMVSVPHWPRPQHQPLPGASKEQQQPPTEATEAQHSARSTDSVAQYRSWAVAQQLAGQAAVYSLALGPPLHVALSHPEAFFGMLNVQTSSPLTCRRACCSIHTRVLYRKFILFGIRFREQAILTPHSAGDI